jgi:Zn-dependent protease with chaperone function
LSGIPGCYYDGKTSARREVEVWIESPGTVRVGAEPGLAWPLSEVRISERIGEVPRRLAFPDGSLCELADNDSLDRALDALGAGAHGSRIARWERRWPLALAALATLAACVGLGLAWGVPALARHGARAIPETMDQTIGRGGLDFLDETFFDRSALPGPRQQEIQARFAAMTRPLEGGHEYRLEFRKGGPLGANAFALPSGIVVLTDELVYLSDDEREIAAVLAHEVGHVIHRHWLRLLLEDSAATLLLVSVLGDVSSASVLVASVPTALVEAKHSRAVEAEADEFAHGWLERNGIPNHHFADLLRRLEREHGGGGLSYFSSHPPAEERARN